MSGNVTTSMIRVLHRTFGRRILRVLSDISPFEEPVQTREDVREINSRDTVFDKIVRFANVNLRPLRLPISRVASNLSLRRRGLSNKHSSHDLLVFEFLKAKDESERERIYQEIQSRKAP